MEQKEFKYDVAFSFKQEDEARAMAIKDLMQGRLDVFIYTERQKEIAGNNGEEMLNKVFLKEARIVVVLYRDGWGEGWGTRVEKNAIQNRNHDESYDRFTVFIKVQDDATFPGWLPKNLIYYNLTRYGEKGAASLIEYRVQEAGGTIQEESVADRATRLSRQMDAEKARDNFLNSQEGVDAALNEVDALFGEVKSFANQCSGFNFTINDNKNAVEILHKDGGTIVLEWYQSYNSKLCVELWNLPPEHGHRRYFDDEEQPQNCYEECYDFYRDLAGVLGWRNKSDEESFLTSKQLAEECIKRLIDHVYEQHTNQISKGKTYYF